MKHHIFAKSKPVIGVLQLLPLPGSLQWSGKLDDVIARAEQEAAALATGGVDGILVENTLDAPYVDGRIDSAGAIAMALIIRRIMHFTNLPIGVSVLKNDPETALAIATNVGARFIRVGLLTGAGLWESGVLHGRHRELEAYRKQLQSDKIAIYADISLERAILPAHLTEQPIQALKTLARQALEQGGADALILTGGLAGKTLTSEEIREITYQLDAPVYYDYNSVLNQAGPYFETADGLFVANAIKKSSIISQNVHPTVDLTKVEELMTLAEMVRSGQKISGQNVSV